MADTKTMIEQAYSAFIRALVSAIQIFPQTLAIQLYQLSARMVVPTAAGATVAFKYPV
jgi:hypothetical protein